MRLYNQLLTQSKDKFYLVIVLGILASSCIGSIAATLALRNLPYPIELIQVCISVSTSMWYNATILAQLSHNAMINALLLSVVANSIIIILHLI